MCADAMDDLSCPVLSAWKASEAVMNQVLKDKLVVVQYAHLGRSSLADNVDLLAPVICHLGVLV